MVISQAKQTCPMIEHSFVDSPKVVCDEHQSQATLPSMHIVSGSIRRSLGVQINVDSFANGRYSAKWANGMYYIWDWSVQWYYNPVPNAKIGLLRCLGQLRPGWAAAGSQMAMQPQYLRTSCVSSSQLTCHTLCAILFLCALLETWGGSSQAK